MFNNIKASIYLLPLCVVPLMTGCATATLLEKDSGVRTKNIKTTLVNDQVVSFGKPAQPIANLPTDSIVIVGQKHNYILTQGGAHFLSVISSLDPKFIQIKRELTFFSEKNDGQFTGSLPLSYVKLAEDVTKEDRLFFIKNNAQECTTSSDQKLNAQRFCFDLKLAGVVYPMANNIGSLKSLSKPYEVSIYTTSQVKDYSNTGNKTFGKLVLFPFAVAFDVVTLPFQAVQQIFD